MNVPQNASGIMAGSVLPEKPKISSADVWLLMNDKSNENRAVAAQKICRTVRTLDMSDRERAVVTEILTFIAKDAAAMVRRAMAVTLKNSPNLPAPPKEHKVLRFEDIPNRFPIKIKIAMVKAIKGPETYHGHGCNIIFIVK